MTKPASRYSLISGLLAVAALGVMPGCGDSAASTADKNVKQASDEAARLAYSAGEARPTEKLVEAVAQAGWQGENQKALDAKLKGSLDVAKGYDAALRKLNEYMKSGSVEADLTAATKKLKDALNGGPDDAMLALGQMQLGNTMSDLVAVQMNDAAARLQKLVVAYGDLTGTAMRYNGVSVEASVGDTVAGEYRKVIDSKVTEELAKAQALAESTAADVTARTEEVKTRQADVDVKQKAAEDARSRAQELAMQADRAKGDEAMGLYEKSAALRDSSAQARAEATQAQPELDKAKAELDKATVMAAAAKVNLEDLTKMKARMEESATTATKGAGTARDVAKALLAAEKEGFNEQLSALQKDAKELSDKLKGIGASTKTIQESFAKAKVAMDKYRTSVNEAHKEAGAQQDPLVKGVSNKQLDKVMDLSVSMAQTRSGQAHLMASDVAKMIEQAENLNHVLTNGTASAMGDVAASESKAAQNDFEAASATAAKVKDLGEVKNTPLAWISQMVYAVAEEGLATAGPADMAKDHHEKAVAAAARAQELNGQVTMTGVTGGTME